MVLLQLVVAATGNYGFFNVLTVALCLPLLDDRLLRRKWPSNESTAGATESAGAKPGANLRRMARGLICVVLVVLSAFQMTHTMRLNWAWPETVITLYRHLQPFHLVSGDGLFAVMTTVRHEIQVEGSAEGETWVPYRFRWKPDRVGEMPSFVQPHMPRLDWQMWFAALRPHRADSWFSAFLAALLRGQEEVLNLLGESPFEATPKYVRARLYRYEFSNSEELSSTGDWWRRTFVGEYTQTYSLSR